MTRSTLTQNEIAVFAVRHSVPAEQAYTLPTIFGKVAEVAGQPERAIIAQATYSNPGLAAYIKELAEQVS